MSSIHVADDDVADKIVGVMWNTGSDSPALQQIDVDGDVITKKSTAWFDRHPVWGGTKRCILSVDGVPIFGADAKGSDLALDGSAGPVMVSRPAFYVKAEKSGDYLKYWISPSAYPGYVKHPWFFQRGGIERGVGYVGAYMAALRHTAAGALRLHSATGKQPVSGQEIVELSFTGGSVLPVEGDFITGETSLVRGTVISVYKASGDWATLNAAGKILLKMVDELVGFDTGSVAPTIGQTLTCGTATGELVNIILSSGTWGGGNAAGYFVIRGGNGTVFPVSTNITDPLGGLAKTVSTASQASGEVKASFTNPENLKISGATVAVSADIGTILPLTRQLAETYGNNVGSLRWGIEDIWGIDATTMMYLIEYCDWRSQSTTYGIGSGVSSKPAARRFAGENTGSGSSDSNIAANGTGRAIGTDGQVHVVYRGMEDPWGNLYRFAIGIDILDANYRLLKPTGTGLPACPLTADNYIETVNAPYTYDVSLRPDGYWKYPVFEEATRFLFLPAMTGGSNDTYSCDWASLHRSGQTNIMLVGGYWYDGAKCGVGCRGATNVASSSSRYCGCRAEFL